jgi:hypothetical protein
MSDSEHLVAIIERMKAKTEANQEEIRGQTRRDRSQNGCQPIEDESQPRESQDGYQPRNYGGQIRSDESQDRHCHNTCKKGWRT